MPVHSDDDHIKNNLSHVKNIIKYYISQASFHFYIFKAVLTLKVFPECLTLIV